jgi:nucleoid DNA-binding protein
MTKAELIEEVSRVIEMTREDSEIIVAAIFDSIVEHCSFFACWRQNQAE